VAAEAVAIVIGCLRQKEEAENCDLADHLAGDCCPQPLFFILATNSSSRLKSRSAPQEQRSIFNSAGLYSKSTNQLQEHPDGPNDALSLVSILEVECSRSH
jgi:hypothetical protein